MAFDDPFAGIESKSKSKPRKPRPEEKFDQPLKITRKEAARATGTSDSTMHGKYYQLTTRLPMDVVDQIRQWASELNMTQQDLQRYCFYRGLQALEEGERPEFEEVVVQKKLKPPE